MKKTMTTGRIVKYVLGMMILAIGLTLAAETALGTSPLTSIAFVLSVCLHQSFANMTLVMFLLFVLIQIVLEKKKTAKQITMLLLQIPLSLLFTRVMGIAQQRIDLTGYHVAVRFLFLLFAIVLTGVGAAMSLKENLIPNPGDGVVKALAKFFSIPLGKMKNIFDVVNVAIAATISFVILGRLEGVHIGSICAMFGVGRIIALYMYLTAPKE